MSIRLLTFDLDDTLWPLGPTLQAAEAELHAWLLRSAPQLGNDPAATLQAVRLQLLRQEPGLAPRLSSLRRRVLLDSLLQAGYPQDWARRCAEQAFSLFLDARHRLQLFPDTRPTLAQLARDYRLGVISNGNADIHRLDLGHHFDFALSAEQLGIGKPHALPFQHALQCAGLAAGQAVHIGDHPDDDIRGAQQAGLRAVWFNPQQRPWPGPGAPDGQIRRLAELPALLLRLSAD